jgi:hypothetical protein
MTLAYTPNETRFEETHAMNLCRPNLLALMSFTFLWGLNRDDF